MILEFFGNFKGLTTEARNLNIGNLKGMWSLRGLWVSVTE